MLFHLFFNRDVKTPLLSFVVVIISVKKIYCLIYSTKIFNYLHDSQFHFYIYEIGRQIYLKPYETPLDHSKLWQKLYVRFCQNQGLEAQAEAEEIEKMEKRKIKTRKRRNFQGLVKI